MIWRIAPPTKIIAALLADYWQKTVDRTVEKWRFSEVDYSSARNDFGGWRNAPNHPNWSA
jgi:hypothetical protein